MENTCHPEGQQKGNRERREEKDYWETAVQEKMEQTGSKWELGAEICFSRGKLDLRKRREGVRTWKRWTGETGQEQVPRVGEVDQTSCFWGRGFP